RTIRALRNQIKHVREVSPFYKTVFGDVVLEGIESLDDFARLPLTDRTSLAGNASQFTAVSPAEVIETVATGGATARPLYWPLTSSDLDRLAFSEALSLHGLGLTPEDRVLLLVGFDHFSFASMGLYRGCLMLGANTGRAGLVPLDLGRHYLEAFEPTVLVGAPSSLRRFSTDLAKSGFKTGQCSVKKIVCTGESLKNQDLTMNTVGKKLEELWGAKAFVSYTINEIADSLCECEKQQGVHCHPELIYTEILDDKGQPVPDQTPGELVVTSFGIEGMPLVRYRTGDITFKVPGACACGRNSARLGPVLGRVSELIRQRDAVVYPLTVTNALDEMDEIADYVIVLENDSAHSDRASIHVAAQPSVVERIAMQVRSAAQCSFPILVSNISTIQSMRKPWHRNARIIDRRMPAVNQ
ncbi:MAG: AMP-binding protein, partial [Chitinispirillaceae bacterium]|nr:AMP-binding protein [Chitinispirillaceae bacterium]